MTHAVDLSDDNLRDLIQALEDAQAELACGPDYPTSTALWKRWEILIQRFHALLLTEPQP